MRGEPLASVTIDGFLSGVATFSPKQRLQMKARLKTLMCAGLLIGFVVQCVRIPTQEEIRAEREWAMRRGMDPDSAEANLRHEVSTEWRPMLLEPLRRFLNR